MRLTAYQRKKIRKAKEERKQNRPIEEKKQLVIGPASIPQEQFVNSDADIVIASGSAGSSKALRHGSKVLTPNGWINIENIKVGDVITDPYAGTQSVTAVYPQGIVDIYRVKFIDGSYVDCSADHLWTISLSGASTEYIVSTTRLIEILAKERAKPKYSKGIPGVSKSVGRKNWPLVRLCAPQEFNPEAKKPEDYKIHPYVIGTLIGDGCLVGDGTSTITSADPELIERMQSFGANIRKHPSSAYGYGVLGIYRDTVDLDLRHKSDKKYIPKTYLDGSIETRLEILRGLMDTDGEIDKDGNPSFTSTSKVLAEQVQFIIRSLGGTASMHSHIGKYKKDGKIVECLRYWNLYIRLPDASQIFSLERKKSRCKIKKVKNRIVDVEFIEQDYATCISITGNRREFVTDNFIVTHNSYGILLKWIPRINDPNARGMIFRRTSGQLLSPGGLWSEALSLFPLLDPGLSVNISKTEITFSSGALLKFSHYENEATKTKIKGVQIDFAACDEGTEFTEEMVTYILSRNRNGRAKNKCQLVLATNPDYDSFLRTWVEWWLDPVTGIPDRAKNGIKRWFVRIDGQFHWADTKEELEAIYGDKDDNGILSMAVIGSTCQDNPFIPQSYVSKLKGLSAVEVSRLLHGSWYARAEAAGYFKREWLNELLETPGRVTKRVRAWDFAGTLASAANPNPDWTVGVLMSRTLQGRYVIEDVIRFRGRFHEVEQKLFETAQMDGPDVIVGIPRDPGQAGAAYCSNLIQELARKGYTARAKPALRSKLDRFRPFAAAAEANLVDYVKADWNSVYLTELEAFNGDGKGKDDQADATSDAYSIVRQSVELPNFTLPNLTQENKFAIRFN